MSHLPSGRRLEDADADSTIVDELAEEAAKLKPPGFHRAKIATHAPDCAVSRWVVTGAPGRVEPRCTCGAVTRDGTVETLSRERAAHYAEILDGARLAGATPSDFDLPDNGMTAFAGDCDAWLEETHARRTQPHFPS